MSKTQRIKITHVLSAVSLGTPENSAIQKLSIIIIITPTPQNKQQQENTQKCNNKPTHTKQYTHEKSSYLKQATTQNKTKTD